MANQVAKLILKFRIDNYVCHFFAKIQIAVKYAKLTRESSIAKSGPILQKTRKMLVAYRYVHEFFLTLWLN